MNNDIGTKMRESSKKKMSLSVAQQKLPFCPMAEKIIPSGETRAVSSATQATQ